MEVLRTLREMMALDTEYGEKGDKLRQILLERYFGDDNFKSSSIPGKILAQGIKPPIVKPVPSKLFDGHSITITVTHGPGAKFLARAGRTLYEVQNMLDKEGAGDLVVELVIKSVHSPSIFMEAVELGIALLEGGNNVIQRGMFNKFLALDPSPAFFRVFYDKMKVKLMQI